MRVDGKYLAVNGKSNFDGTFTAVTHHDGKFLAVDSFAFIDGNFLAVDGNSDFDGKSPLYRYCPPVRYFFVGKLGDVADHTLLLKGRRYPESRDLRWSNNIILATKTIFEYTAALNSMKDGPMSHGLDCGDGSCIDWHRRHVVRVFSARSSGCLV